MFRAFSHNGTSEFWLFANNSKQNYNMMQTGGRHILLWFAYLLMMLTKIQNTEDLAELRKLPSEQIARMDQILENTTEDIRKIMQDVVYALLMKMNVPVEEANEQVKWMGENRMGYFFENFEKVDIQEERRKMAEAQAEAEAAEQKAKEAEYRVFISTCKEFEATKEETVKKVIGKFHFSPEDAVKKVEQYWK